MAEKHDAEERTEVAGAEDLGDEPAGKRHGAKPEQAHQRGEHQHAHLGYRRHEEHAEDRRPAEVEEREHVFLAVPVAEPAGGEGADNVAEPDHGDRRRPQHGSKPRVRQERRQVGGNEIDVEAADEEAAAEQPEAAVCAGLDQRLAQRLSAAFGRHVAAAHPDEARHHHCRYPAVGDERHRPADAVDQRAAHRRQRELPEGTAGRRNAERHAAPLRRHRTPHRAQHHREPGGADANPNQHALAEMQPERAVGPGHPEQTRDVD